MFTDCGTASREKFASWASARGESNIDENIDNRLIATMAALLALTAYPTRLLLNIDRSSSYTIFVSRVA
ncbi:MAG: hypothetical protein AB7W16_03710 [Candidatus Obscuribacterales bacterium]